MSWYARFYVVRTDAELYPADGEVQRMDVVAPGELDAWAASVPVCPDVHPLLSTLVDALPQSGGFST